MGLTVNPIKRDESLKNLSGDHHSGLLYCWKIKKSFSMVETSRLVNYTDYFYTQHLLPHFKLEEKFIFPLLGEETTLVQEAAYDHKMLRSFFEQEEKKTETLLNIVKWLEKHIYFEENILFKELQRLIPNDELALALGRSSINPEDDDWHDRFWER